MRAKVIKFCDPDVHICCHCASVKLVLSCVEKELPKGSDEYFNDSIILLLDACEYHHKQIDALYAEPDGDVN